jgi:hypothetical protein
MVIKHNNFIDNARSYDGSLECNNIDGRDYTLWDEVTFSTNYWYDYKGQDDNDDGVGDTPYLITVEGQEVGQDPSPLMKPWAGIPEPTLLPLLLILSHILKKKP